MKYAWIALALLAFPAQAVEVDAAVLEKLINRIDQLEREVAELKGAKQAAALAPAAGPVAAVPAVVGEDRTPPPVEPIEKSVEDALVKKHAVLLDPGVYEIEPGFAYAHSSSDSVIINGFSIFPVLVVGSVTSEEIRRDTLLGTLTGRVGLPWGMQIDARIPYHYIHEERTAADGTFNQDDALGLGDVSLGLSKELWTQEGALPHLIGRVSWKADTGDSAYDGEPLGIGSGFHSARGEVTALKLTDPAALYATLGYVTNFEERKDAGKIDLGDSVDVSLGTTVALNRELAISLGVQNSWSFESSINGNDINGSSLNVANLNVGFSYELLRDRRLDFTASAGLTRDAPDYTLNVSMPFRFD